MARIIAAGCSYTFGHGLEDCFTPPTNPGPFPSKFAWPQLVSSAVDKECINLATPGGSNKEIAYNLNKFNFKPDDICLIQWTFVHRNTLYFNESKFEKIGSWTSTMSPMSRALVNLPLYDISVNFTFFYNAINYKLMSKGVKVINFKPFASSENNSEDDELFNDLINVDFDYDQSNMGLWKQEDKALDNAHPGPKTHKLFADYVINKYKDVLI
jgi:hypothetical protein